MPYVIIDITDGVYSVRELTDDSANNGMQQGQDFIYVQQHMLRAWQHHLDERDMWNTFWRALDDVHAARMHARELLPLDAAKREIDRLTALVAQLKERP